MITKQMLDQYYDLPREIDETKYRIEQLEKEIDKMEEGGYKEVDSVKGGLGGIEHFKIEGFPYPAYSKKKTFLLTRKSMLVQLQDQLIEQTNEIEKFIAGISDSRMRRIINLRYIDRLTWNQVADKIGGDNTEDSVKKACYRFLAEK